MNISIRNRHQPTIITHPAITQDIIMAITRDIITMRILCIGEAEIGVIEVGMTMIGIIMGAVVTMIEATTVKGIMVGNHSMVGNHAMGVVTKAGMAVGIMAVTMAVRPWRT